MTFVSIYFLVLLVPLIDAARFRCDYSYIPHEGWFKLHREPTDHNTAKRICLKEGAGLVLPLIKGLEIATLSVIENTDVPATHIDFEAAAQRNKDRQEVIKSTCFNDPIIPIVDDDNTTLVLTRNGSFETKPALAKIHFICHKKAGRAEELNECGTTDNGYILDIRVGSCYKLHTASLRWSNAKKICTYEGGKLAVINSEIEAQAIRDLINSSVRVTNSYVKRLYVGIKFKKYGRDWLTVDGYPLSMSGYEKWGERINAKVDKELCGTVNRNASLYAMQCEPENTFFICEKKIQDCNHKFTPDIGTGNCYKFHRTRVVYDDARKLCMYEGANLAVINNKADARAIGDLFNRNPSYHQIKYHPGHYVGNLAYLGKYKHVNIQKSKTVDGDSLPMYGHDKWAPEVLIEEERCMTVKRNGLLHVKQCTLMVPFICQRTNQDCDGYTLDYRTGHCYKFHRLGSTWSRALEICTKEGGTLAVINSETEYQVIRDLLNSNPPDTIPQYLYRENSVFLGINRRKSVWVWRPIIAKYLYREKYMGMGLVDSFIWEWKTADGYPPRINDSSSGLWAPGEPNNAEGDELCVTMRRNSLLYDESCNRVYPFICEKMNEDCL